MVHILGLDPGSETGAAVFIDGNLQSLVTVSPIGAIDLIRQSLPDRVVFEDSRLETRLWNARNKQAYGAALAAARSVGQVDRLCQMIVEACELLGIPAHGISPTRKGAKLDARVFAQVTGYKGRCNQHERDAAMVVLSAIPACSLKSTKNVGNLLKIEKGDAK